MGVDLIRWVDALILYSGVSGLNLRNWVENMNIGSLGNLIEPLDGSPNFPFSPLILC